MRKLDVLAGEIDVEVVYVCCELVNRNDFLVSLVRGVVKSDLNCSILLRSLGSSDNRLNVQTDINLLIDFGFNDIARIKSDFRSERNSDIRGCADRRLTDRRGSIPKRREIFRQSFIGYYRLIIIVVSAGLVARNKRNHQNDCHNDNQNWF